MAQFVYIVERGDEPDVYADRDDAEEAVEILGANEDYVPMVIEQMVFPSSKTTPTTREWLDELRADQE